MDGHDYFIEILINTGFAIAVASFLIKYLVTELNKKLDKLIELSEKQIELLREMCRRKR